jgi:hypothetical protein
MDTLESALSTDLHNPWIFIPALLFVVLIAYFSIKFFSFFFKFFQAKGCLTILVIALIGLPGLVAITLLAGIYHYRFISDTCRRDWSYYRIYCEGFRG